MLAAALWLTHTLSCYILATCVLVSLVGCKLQDGTEFLSVLFTAVSLAL